MSVSIADLWLLIEIEKSRLLITAVADGEAVREAMKKRRRELAFSCVSSDACRLRGTPAGTILYFHTLIKSFLESLEPFSQKRF